MKRKYLLGTMAIVATVAFTGCASTSETMMQQGYGPNYSHGYEDGCSSGRKAGGSMLDQFTKNVQQYDSNHKYKEGWDDGYQVCHSEEKQLMKNIANAQRNTAIKNRYKN